MAISDYISRRQIVELTARFVGHRKQGAQIVKFTVFVLAKLTLIPALHIGKPVLQLYDKTKSGSPLHLRTLQAGCTVLMFCDSSAMETKSCGILYFQCRLWRYLTLQM